MRSKQESKKNTFLNAVETRKKKKYLCQCGQNKKEKKKHLSQCGQNKKEKIKYLSQCSRNKKAKKKYLSQCGRNKKEKKYQWTSLRGTRLLTRTTQVDLIDILLWSLLNLPGMKSTLLPSVRPGWQARESWLRRAQAIFFLERTCTRW